MPIISTRTVAQIRRIINELMTDTCTIHTAGTVNPDDQYGGRLGATDTTTACRATYLDVQYQTPDGTLGVSSCQLDLPYSLTPPEAGTVTLDKEYRILKRQPLTDGAGHVLEWRLLLGGKA